MNNRVNLTTSCRDCDTLPKHDKAGIIETTNNTKYQYMHNGLKIKWDTYHSPWMNTIISKLKGHHEPQEELCFYHILETMPEKANMIELGCHWAYYSMWFNKKIKDSYNLCMEPVRENLDGGIANSKLNECENMEFIQGCVTEVFRPDMEFTNWDNKKYKMPGYPLQKLMEDRDIFVDVVHSDIQGAESHLLKKSIPVLPKIGYFIISTHGGVHPYCQSFLEDNNFQILVQHSVNESYSGDGLIVAINKLHINKYEENIDEDLISYFHKNCKISKK